MSSGSTLLGQLDHGRIKSFKKRDLSDQFAAFRDQVLILMRIAEEHEKVLSMLPSLDPGEWRDIVRATEQFRDLKRRVANQGIRLAGVEKALEEILNQLKENHDGHQSEEAKEAGAAAGA